MATILITGGTGMIGTAVSKEMLAAGHSVIIMGRRIPDRSQQLKGAAYAVWDPAKGSMDTDALKQTDAIIHLAGANLAEKRWTDNRKKELVASRVEAGHTLVKALQSNPHKVRTLIAASAIGWYGPDPIIPNPTPFEETAPHDNSFLGQTCGQWEAATAAVETLGIRRVVLRFGIVLSNTGGAYMEFRKPIRFGLAAVLGNGRQVISWIHIRDLVGIIRYSTEREELYGIYNAVASSPVTNKNLVTSIAKARGGFKLTAAVPSIVLKAMLGEMSGELLKSTTVSNKKIRDAGYIFKYPTIEEAILQLEAE